MKRVVESVRRKVSKEVKKPTTVEVDKAVYAQRVLVERTINTKRISTGRTW